MSITLLLATAIALALAAHASVFAIRRPNAMGIVIIAALASPFFIDMSSGRPAILRIFGSGTSQTGLQIGIFVIILGLLGYLGRRSPIPDEAWLFRSLALVFTASIAVGLTIGAGSNGLMYYIQTMIPIAAWFALARVKASPIQAHRAIVLTTSASLVLVLSLSLIVTGGITGSISFAKELSTAIPQYLNYFPYVVACGLSFAAADIHRNPRRSLICFALAMATLPLMWSRTGLGMMAVGAAVGYLAAPARTSRTSRVVAGLFVAIPLGYYAATSVFGGVIGSRASNSADISAADGVRANVAVEAIQRILHRPLLGDTFVPAQSVTAGGAATTRPILFPAHDQYLDYALRGGVVALLLLIAVLVVYIRRSATFVKSADAGIATFHAGLLGLLAASVLGNLTQLYVAQPWTGGLLFALLGLSSSVGRADSDSTGERGTSRPRAVGRWPGQAVPSVSGLRQEALRRPGRPPTGDAAQPSTG